MYIGFIMIMSLAQKVATTKRTFTCSKLLRGHVFDNYRLSV